MYSTQVLASTFSKDTRIQNFMRNPFSWGSRATWAYRADIRHGEAKSLFSPTSRTRLKSRDHHVLAHLTPEKSRTTNFFFLISVLNTQIWHVYLLRVKYAIQYEVCSNPQQRIRTPLEVITRTISGNILHSKHVTPENNKHKSNNV